MKKNNLITHIHNILNANESTHSFALFRILFCLITLAIIKEVYFFAPILFDSVEGIGRNPFPARLFLALWSLSVFMLCIGFKTPIFATVNYFFTIIATAFFSNTNTGTFNDDLLRIGSFLIIFMPISRSFSVDAFINQLHYKTPPKKQTLYYNYFFFIFLSLGMMYFGSGLTKSYSDMWNRGLGLWIPSSMPHNHWNEIYTLYIDHYWLVTSLSWLVVTFELSFIFLLLYKPFHWIVATIGIGFHLGIAIIFPFPIICIGPIIFYSLFIPNRFWKWLSIKMESQQKINIEFDSSNFKQEFTKRFFCAIDFRKKLIFIDSQNNENLKDKVEKIANIYWFTKPLVWLIHVELFRLLLDYMVDEFINKESFKSDYPATSMSSIHFKRTVFGLFIGLCIFLQLAFQIYHVYSYHKAGPKNITKYFKTRKSMKDFSLKPSNIARVFWGINSRGVFLDHSNQGTKNIYGITYFNKDGKEIWLPFIDQRGFSVGYNMNIDWPKYSFNSVCVSTNPADSIELRKYTLFWAVKNKYYLDSVAMNVYRKQYYFPRVFEMGYHQKLRDIPWILEGKILWKKYKFTYTQINIDTTYKIFTRE